MRRGSENIDKFLQTTFSVRLHIESNLKYITKEHDEMTKNHKEKSTDLVTSCISQIPGYEFCPVHSFEMYIEHLNPDCKFMWQKPKEKKDIKNNIWYCNAKLGENILGKFMTNMSRDAQLSKKYSNHCICVTGCTFLTTNNFTSKQIMFVTGHHSLNSLAIYQKVSNDEKMTMGLSMNYFMNSDNVQPNVPPRGMRPIAPKPAEALGAPPPKKTCYSIQQNESPPLPAIPPPLPRIPMSPIANNNNMIMPIAQQKQNQVDDQKRSENLPGTLNFDILDFLTEVEQDEQDFIVNTQDKSVDQQVCTSMRSIQKTVKRSPNLPIFNYCQIGEIHFHVAKK